MKVLSAQVELAAGNMEAAEQTLKALIASDASQLDAYDLLGRVYASQGKVDDAVRQDEALAQRSPSGAAGARTMIGMLREARKDREGARRAYEQALERDPHAGVAANNLAWIYAADGKLDKALRLATIAQASLRRRPEAEDTLGWIYLQKGETSRAIAGFERARDRAPQNPVYHYHLGLAHLKSGDNARARIAFTRALELRSDFAEAADARAQLAAIDEAMKPWIPAFSGSPETAALRPGALPRPARNPQGRRLSGSREARDRTRGPTASAASPRARATSGWRHRAARGRGSRRPSSFEFSISVALGADGIELATTRSRMGWMSLRLPRRPLISRGGSAATETARSIRSRSGPDRRAVARLTCCGVQRHARPDRRSIRTGRGSSRQRA